MKLQVVKVTKHDKQWHIKAKTIRRMRVMVIVMKCSSVKNNQPTKVLAYSTASSERTSRENIVGQLPEWCKPPQGLEETCF